VPSILLLYYHSTSPYTFVLHSFRLKFNNDFQFGKCVRRSERGLRAHWCSLVVKHFLNIQNTRRLCITFLNWLGIPRTVSPKGTVVYSQSVIYHHPSIQAFVISALSSYLLHLLDIDVTLQFSFLQPPRAACLESLSSALITHGREIRQLPSNTPCTR
jgi:hypothetical protein